MRTILLAVAVAALSLGTLRAQDKAVTIADIKKAWQARQDRVKSGKFVIEETQTDMRGSQSHFLSGDERKHVVKFREKMGLDTPPVGTPLPETDTTFKVEKEVWFSENGMRYSLKGDYMWAPMHLCYEWAHKISVFDGKTAKSLDVDGSKRAPYPSGHISRDPVAIDAGIPTVRIVLMHYRAMNPLLRSSDIESFVLTGNRSLINGKPAIELRRTTSPVSRSSTWVAPGQGFAILRTEHVTQELPVQRIDVRYAEDAEHGLVPTGWDILTYDRAGKLQRAQYGKVVSYGLGTQLGA
ncbi:MAG: hypothetical protein K2W96_18130, partial [Gemmataceae bacterium]|nr:hypothetical protein [Gemmataceae bacterium]